MFTREPTFLPDPAQTLWVVTGCIVNMYLFLRVRTSTLACWGAVQLIGADVLWFIGTVVPTAYTADAFMMFAGVFSLAGLTYVNERFIPLGSPFVIVYMIFIAFYPHDEIGRSSQTLMVWCVMCFSLGMAGARLHSTRLGVFYIVLVASALSLTLGVIDIWLFVGHSAALLLLAEWDQPSRPPPIYTDLVPLENPVEVYQN